MQRSLWHYFTSPIGAAHGARFGNELLETNFVCASWCAPWPWERSFPHPLPHSPSVQVSGFNGRQRAPWRQLRSLWTEQAPEDGPRSVVQAGNGASQASKVSGSWLARGQQVVAVVTHVPGSMEMYSPRGRSHRRRRSGMVRVVKTVRGCAEVGAQLSSAADAQVDLPGDA